MVHAEHQRSGRLRFPQKIYCQPNFSFWSVSLWREKYAFRTKSLCATKAKNKNKKKVSILNYIVCLVGRLNDLGS